MVEVRAITSVGAKFFPFCTSKTYFFYFTHSFLQNTYISLSILHVYSNKIFISLPTQPPTHTGITPESTQSTGNKPSKPEKQTQQPTPVSHRNPHNPPATNPANQKNKPSNSESTQPNNTIQQLGIKTNPTTQSTPPTRNRRRALSNKIDASGGDGENEKQDRRLQRQAVAMAMARDIQPETH